MLRLLLPLSALAACTPSPRKDVMPSPDPISSEPVPQSSTADPRAQNIGQAETPASQELIPGAIFAAGTSAPGSLADSSAAALGRRTLSTAFVRIGPDGYLTVELHSGRMLVLRNVTMNPRKYCGVQISGARYCGDYAEVAAARPGGARASE